MTFSKAPLLLSKKYMPNIWDNHHSMNWRMCIEGIDLSSSKTHEVFNNGGFVLLKLPGCTYQSGMNRPYSPTKYYILQIDIYTNLIIDSWSCEFGRKQTKTVEKIAREFIQTLYP